MKSFYSVVILLLLVFSSRGNALPGCTNAANNNCSGAISLTINAAAVSGSTCGTLEAGELTDCAPAGTDQSVWYSFTATATTLAVTVANSGSCFLSSAVYASSSGCPASTGCQALSCQSASNGPSTNVHQLTNLTIGATYRIQILYASGGPCGNEGGFDISVSTITPVNPSNPAPISTCAAPSGSACVFNYNPTVTDVTNLCTPITNPASANSTNEVVKSCFTFTGQYSTNITFQNIISSNCGAGNVLWFDWQLFDNSCNLVSCGKLSNLNTTGIVCGNSYKMCYTYEVPACTHTTFYPFVTAIPPTMTATAGGSSSVTICEGASTTLSAAATGYVSYSWSPATGLSGTTGATVTASPTSTITYTVTGYDAGGCSQTRTVTVNVNPKPVAAISGVSTICTGQSTTYTASGGGTYVWSTGATSAAITVSTSGTYTVTVSNNGCTATASLTLTVSGTGSAAITGTNSICAGQSSTFTVSGGGTYAWSNGATSAAITVSTAGTYTVTVTNGGCTATATRTLTVTSGGAASISGTNAICAGQSTTLTASGGGTYSWSTGATSAAISVSTAGTYTVTTTNSGCTASASQVVTVNPVLNASITPPAQITCALPSVTLTANSSTGGVTYSWSGGGTAQTKSVSSIGTYTVTITDPANGCTATASVSVSQNITPPNVSIAPPATLTCTISNVNLVASSTTTGAAYNWGAGNTTTTKNVSAPGTYTVTVTDPANGCTATAAVTVAQNITSPAPNISPAAGILTCTLTSITLTASGGGTYQWGSGATSVSVNATGPGTYSVTVTGTNGCTATATAIINQNIAPPVASVTPSSASLTCTVINVGLTASGGGTYAWSTGASTTSINVTTPNTYRVTVTGANGCTATASSIISLNNTTPNVSIAPPALLTCSSTSVTLFASSLTSGVTYSWSGGGTAGNKNVTAPGNYSVTVTDPSNGCTASASVSVGMNLTPPNASIAPPAALTCATTTVNLIASSTTTGAPYNWGGGNTTNTKPVNTPGTYSVTVTDPANGCTASATVSVSQNITAPTASISPVSGTLTCTVTSISLTASGGGTYQWSSGSSTSSASATTPGTYTVTVTGVNGCTATATASINQNITPPTASVTPLSSVLTCTTTTINLVAGGGGTYSWSTSATTTSINVSTQNTYTVTVTGANGCTAAASSNITRDVALPNVNIAPPASLSCVVGTVMLNASSSTSGLTYSWSGGGVGNTKSVAAAGSYSVTVTDPANGCTASASVNVSQSVTPPNVSIASPAALTCSVTNVNLLASSLTPGVSYNWGGGNTTNTKNVTTPGNYSVTVTDPANGCTASATVSVSQNITAPTASINPVSGTLTCTVTSISLTASGGGTYQWSSGSSTSSASATTPGTYTVTVTGANGCTATATASINQNITPPAASVNPTSNVLTCSVTSRALTASGGGTYSWSNSATTSVINVTAPNTYTVTVTGTNGCTATAASSITQDITTPNVSIAPPASLTCSVTSVTLSASSLTSGVTYSWSGGGTGTARAVSSPGAYSVTVTDPSNGCTASASVTVLQTAVPPNVSMAPPSSLTCSVTSINLTASSITSGASFNWGGGNTTNTLSVNTPGTYSVTVTDPSNGCTASATVSVSQNITAPTASISPVSGTLTCTVTSILLTASGGGMYQWSSGSSTSSVSATTPGTYTVTVTGANGCTATATASINQNITPPTASVNPTSNVLTCSVTSRALTASGGGTYSWSNSATTSVINVTTPNTYTVTITAANGCTATAASTITQNITTPNVSIAPPASLSCTANSVTITASSSTSGVTYNWSGGGAGNTKTVTALGSYSVTVTDPANGCTASASVSVSQSAIPPNVSIASPATLTCSVTSINLVASSLTSGITYSWAGGNTSNTLSVSTPGTYSVTVTDPANGCTASTSVSVTQNIATPNVSIAPPGSITCTVPNVTLAASSTTTGATYLWSGGGTGATKAVGAAGTYSVTVTNPANGCTASAFVSVSQSASVPTLNVTTPGALTCLVSSVSMTASSATTGVTYIWNGGSTNPTRTVSLPGIYSVTVTDPANGCSASTAVSVSQNIAAPDIALNSSSNLSCSVTSVTLTASSTTFGVGYNWSGGGIVNTKTVSTPGTYSVTITDPANGCTASVSVSVSANTTVPNISIATPANLTCSVAIVTVSASSTTTGVTYTWSGGGNMSSISVSTPGSYSVTVTNPANNCTASASVSVNQNIVNPTVSINTPAVLTCTLTSVSLTTSSSPGTLNYVWSSGGSLSSKMVSVPGLYTVTVTDPANGCTGSASAGVSQNIVKPGAAIAPPAILTCLSATVTLTGSSPTTVVTYSWSGGGTSATKNVTSPGNYTVTVTDPSNGCTSSALVSVSQNSSPPNVSIATPGALNCLNASVVLSASSITAGVNYNWGGGVTTNTNTVSAAGNYSVTITDPSNGCTSSASVTVNQNTSIPNVSIAPPASLTCTVTSVTLTASSATSGVTYLWSGGSTGSTANVSSPGSYSVTVTYPANGCTASVSTNVVQSVPLPNVSITNPATLTCATTSVTLVASSTTNGVTFNWGSGNTTTSKTVSLPGNYSVTVTDPSNGCQSSTSVNVVQNIISPDVSIAPPTTLTCSQTSVTLSASSTVTGVNYNWSGGGTLATKNVTSSGVYIVTVTDPVNGCTAIGSVTISQNIVAPNISIASPAILTCSNTTATLTASSITTGVNYNWGSGNATTTQTVSSPGIYSVTVSDTSNGCTASSSVTVSQNVIIPNVSIAPPGSLTCTVNSIMLTASSSTNGATYAWSGGGTGANTNISSPGSYSVTATDPANGCTASASVSVNQSVPLPNVSIGTPAILTCVATSTTLVASSSTTGVTYNWGGGNTTNTQTVLLPGNYSVTVTNPSNGCQSSASVNVVQNIISPDVSITPPATITCTQTLVTLSASSRVNGVSYAWNGGGTAATNNVTSAGNYTVTITDPVNGCTASDAVFVTANTTAPGVNIATPALLTCSITDITLTASSQTAGVTYSWSSGSGAADQATISPGTYVVTATDPSNGCTSTASVIVDQNITAPGVSILPPASLTCAVTSVTLTASSATGGVTYVWSAGATGSTATVSSPGSFSVTVTDPANGCTASVSTNVVQSVPLPNVSITNPATLTCATSNVTLVASSSTNGVTFNWGAGNTTTTKTVSLPGNYSVTVTDPSNGCQSSTSVNVVQNIISPDVSIAPPATLTCSQTSVTLSASSMVNGVNYNWSGGGTGATRNITSPGNFSVTVTDPVNGCSASASVSVIQNTNIPDLAIDPADTLTCAITSVILSATSATPGVTYVWTGGGNSNTQSVSSSGIYSVTVTDPVNGCTASASVNVSQSVPLPNVSIAPPPALNCTTTGIILVASSTAPNVTFDWGGGNTTPSLAVDAPGNYSVTVTNPIDGCKANTSVIVNQNIAAPSVNISPASLLTCVVNNVTLNVTSSAVNASYFWSGGINTANYAINAAGNYFVTVTDIDNGCTGSASVTVNQDTVAPVVSVAPVGSLSCTGTDITLTASSSTSGVTYNWNGIGNGPAYVVNIPGMYGVTVTDPANGCTGSASMNVVQNITVPDVEIDPPSDLTCLVTSVSLVASSSVSQASYSWGNGNNSSTYNVSSPGIYAVTITDTANGCTSSASANVVQIGGLTLTVTPTEATCNGSNNGAADLQVSGGQSPYSFQWSNLANTEDLTAVSAGNFNVTVTDNVNCSATASVVVTEPLPLLVSETHLDVTCYGSGNGNIDISTNGGTGPYSYVWNDGLTTQNRSQLSGGGYSVTVNDANQCSAVANIGIQEPGVIDVFETHTDLLCSQDRNASIDVTARGGSQPYTYQWNDAATTEDRSQLPGGNYTITVTDVNQCTAVMTINIIQPSPLSFTPTVKQPTCPENGNDGDIFITPAGATPPFQFNWSNGRNTPDNASLSTGTYTVTITDANSCSATASFNLDYQYQFSMDAFPNAATIEAGSSIALGYQLTGTGGNITSQKWTPDETLDCGDCAAPNASPLVTTTYQIEVTNEAGCSAKDEVIITVIPGNTIFLPNVFTPNNDGINDVFEMFGNVYGIAFVEIQLFNRWGELVFESNDHHFKWDGSYKGEMQTPQVFVWNLRLGFRDGHTESMRKGTVQLLK